MNINKVFIYGNLTRDPEVRQLPNGTQVAQLGIATNRTYKNQQGESVTDVEYHNLTMFGRLAELAQQYLKKGSGAFFEGRLRTSSWEADGVKKYKTEIIVEQMQFGPRRDGGGDTGDGNKSAGSSKDGVDAPASEDFAQAAPTINPEDIPF